MWCQKQGNKGSHNDSSYESSGINSAPAEYKDVPAQVDGENIFKLRQLAGEEIVVHAQDMIEYVL